MRLGIRGWIAVGLFATATLAQAAGGAAWGYHGKLGPERWGKLSKEYLLCEIGKNQSPIDIDRVRVLRTDLRPIQFQYE
ncbi:MAG TPA: carbonic anhydrase family protein, partial [Hydrogenophilus thermoluteolus]|nr:carbonic anhydrase family protein [Hydrogenophilus thermoluteolus]